MLVIRLQRTGRKNAPAFRVVLAEKRWSAKKKCIEVLGHYLPDHEPPVFEVDQERIGAWIAKGAQPSDTVARLLTRAGMKGLTTFIVPYAKRKPKKEVPKEEVKEEKKAEGKEEPKQEEKKEEVKEIEEAPKEDKEVKEVKEEAKEKGDADKQ